MKFWLLTGFLAVAGLVLLPSQARALTISPVRSEVAGDPGETVRGEMLLINEEESTKVFYSSFENFEASGESGTPSFVEGVEGLATWIETESQVTLSQNERQEISYAIHIPQDADPGGYFGAIFWSTVPPVSKGEGVSIGAKVGSLILLRVSGEVPEGGAVLEFSTKEGGSFFSSLPVEFEYRFQNGGGDRLKPEGEIKITNLFGSTSATLNANPNDGNVLPGSTRKFSVVWEKAREKPPTEALAQEKNGKEGGGGFFNGLKQEWSNFAFGRYTAHLDLTFGTEQESVAARTSFFVVPWRILSIIALLVVIFAFLLRFGLKRYNRWIIAKATAQQGGKRTKNKKNE